MGSKVTQLDEEGEEFLLDSMFKDSKRWCCSGFEKRWMRFAL
jgi:hypothetical protein